MKDIKLVSGSCKKCTQLQVGIDVAAIAGPCNVEAVPAVFLAGLTFLKQKNPRILG